MKLFLILLAIIMLSNSCKKSPNKIACVGDSITFGFQLSDPIFAYPNQLKTFFPNAIIKNFGVNGSSVNQSSDLPYHKTPAFRKSKEFLPDTVIIFLGTNDTKKQNFTHIEKFKNDYNFLIDTYENLSSKPKIYICLPCPIFNNPFGLKSENLNIVNNKIKQIAQERQLYLIDVYTALKDSAKNIPDGIHPNKIATEKITKKIASCILKDYK